MSIQQKEVAAGVRVKLNSTWKAKSLGEEYFKSEKFYFIKDNHIYNDQFGYYVFVQGSSLGLSYSVYLTELDLEYPIPKVPIY